MENKRNSTKSQVKKIKIGYLLFLYFTTINLYAQNQSLIIGKIIEENSKQPVPYATVLLKKTKSTQSQLTSGTISNNDGSFSIPGVQKGEYILKITAIGYNHLTKNLVILSPKTYDLGTIFIHDSTQFISEALVIGERIKGKSEGDKTIFFMNKNILQTSGNAPDLLRHIPGVQVDLKQNISIDGSQNILLFVNGKEHDKSYISQLNPSSIDKIEILNSPPSNYDGNISGVINIILKKEKNIGFSGHVYSEIPTSRSVVYSFPNCGFNYNFNKINIYSSYNGEINYENIDETTERVILKSSSAMHISSIQQVRQKNISHKLHYGIDYYLTQNDILNFYGFFNPYSYQQDGDVIVEAKKTAKQQIWDTQKEETDKNKNIFNSIYYNHQFKDKGGKLSIDISNAYLYSDNTVYYIDNTDEKSSTINTESPRQTTSCFKIDYTKSLSKKFKFNAGCKIKIQDMHNKTTNDFNYNEQIYALYVAINHKKENIDFKIGLRGENTETELYNSYNSSTLSFLPYSTFHYKLNSKQNIQLSFRRSLYRPSVYSLNPYTYTDDPYTIRKGNPMLKPEFQDKLTLEHSILFHSNFFSSRLFYERRTNCINNLTILNDS